MSASIETRIVEMKFDNTQFEQGIRQTLSSLSSLEKGMRLDGAGKGLGTAAKGINELNASAKRFTLAPIGNAVQQVSAKFSAMTVVGAAALGSLVAQATQAGVLMARGLFGPLNEGFQDYELKIGATQTIMAGTGESIGQVTKYLKELDIYADQTIYSLSDMVSNIGKFTNAGVDLKTATNAMKGISNVAAVSGASTGEAARAMYNLGQAIGQGTVKLMDWRSVELANMGTKEFKEQLIQSAVAAGTLKKGLDGTLKTSEGNAVTFKNFSTTLQDGWLTAEALTDTLGRYADETTTIGKKAYAAAKDVKSFTMMVTTLKAAIGTGWTDTFDIVIGNLPEAKKMWTDLSNTLGELMTSSADARNKLLGDWKELGGRMALIVGIKKTFQALMAAIQPIKDAFRAIFPATTAQQLYDMTTAFRDFMDGLKMGPETALKVARVFQGIFAVFDIGWILIKQVAGVFRDLFSSATEGSSGLLDIAAKIGDWLTGVRHAIKYGEGLNQFFDGLTAVLQKPIEFIKKMASALKDMFGQLGNGPKMDFSVQFGPLGTLASTVAAAWKSTGGILDKVAAVALKLPQLFSDAFASLGETLSKFFGEGFNFEGLLVAIEAGLFLGLVTAVLKFVKRLREVADEVGGISDVIKESVGNIVAPFEALTETLEAMQMTLRAATLLQIAAAVALLAYALVQISKIDEKDMQKALKGIAVLFIQLSVAMAIFQKIEIRSGMVQLIALAYAIKILADAVAILGGLDYIDMIKGLQGVGLMLIMLVLAADKMPDGKKMISSSLGLILMATAVKILASAVKDLSDLSWEEMAKGLTGVAVMLTALGLYARFGSTNAGGIAGGVGIILLATGIKILASALKDMSSLGWEEMARGLTAMGGGLLLMGAALKLIPPSSVLSAAAVLIMASSLGMLADALGQMGSMEWEEIGKGLVVLGGALTLIAAALALIPPTSILSAAAIFIVVASLGLLTNSLQAMASMGWEEIAKGLVVLGGALLIIAVAVTAMVLALPGAMALVVIVGALALFLPVLLLLGNMSWEEIAKGLLTLAGTFLVLGVAGALLTPVIPTLLGLGLAITLLGIGMAAAGAGLLMFATGLTALAVSGAAGAASIVAIVAALVGLIPMVMAEIGRGVVAFAKVIATSGPAITGAITTVLMSFLNAIIRLTPKIGQTFLVMLNTLLRILVTGVPMMVRAGMQLIIGVLNGIAANIGRMITAATNVVVAFLNGLSANQGRIIDAGVKLIISFVNGVANAIRSNSAQMGAAGMNLATAIVEGMARGIAGGLGVVTSAAKRLASSALDAAKNALGIKSPSREFAKLGAFSAAGYAKGLDGSKAQIYASAKTMRDLLKTTMTESAKDIASLQARLKKLNSARVKDRAEIAKTTKALREARSEYSKASAAYKMQGTWSDEYWKLGKMADQQAWYAKKLEEANKKLADAIKARDDYNAQIKNQYKDLPDIDANTQLGDYISDLQKKVVNNQLFTAQLVELRKLGLNDDLYKELVAKGVDAMPFAQQILEGGKGKVNELNSLTSSLDKSAGSLANTASKALYQAGVDAAAGLVKGLQAKHAALEKQMDALATSMVKAIKKKLGIKSPSREFMKIGDWTTRGLAKGLENSTAPVKAAEHVGQNAIDAMRKTLTGLSDIVRDEVKDVNPTVRPVLDLTEVKKDAGRIGSMLNTQPLEVSGAYSQAVGTSLAVRQREAAMQPGDGDRTGTQLTFVQNNYSPKTISPADTYRNTKNQLSRAKGALGK